MAFADSAGTRIYWEEHGSGEPLLLIMGLGYPLDMWHRTVPVVSKHYRTIVFDNRGAGRSGAPPGPYSMAMMAGDAAAVLDTAGLTSAHVFGISMGGMIAQELTLAHPARVRKLVLGCTGCGGEKAVRAEPEATAMLLNRARMTAEEAVEAAVPFVYHPHTPRERIEEDLAIRRRTLPAAEAYTAQLQAILGWQSYDRLGQVTAPVLVIHGENDRLVPAGNGKLIADTIRGARWVLLPEASHLFTTDQPERAHAEILRFLASEIR
jgi:pimeloyl-ACP methyl ester carboxylesterase